MARRYDHTPEELRELAIQSGIAMLEEVGFSRFSARGVATRMGYTVGTLYNLFESLDLFLLHLNARTLDEWYAMLVKKLETEGGDKIRILARGYLEFARTHYHRFTALFEHKMAEVPAWYNPKMHRLFELVETALDLQEQDAEKTRHVAKVLWASIHGISVLSLSGKLEVVGADSAEKLMETVLRALLAKA